MGAGLTEAGTEGLLAPNPKKPPEGVVALGAGAFGGKAGAALDAGSADFEGDLGLGAGAGEALDPPNSPPKSNMTSGAAEEDEAEGLLVAGTLAAGAAEAIISDTAAARGRFK